VIVPLVVIWANNVAKLVAGENAISLILRVEPFTIEAQEVFHLKLPFEGAPVVVVSYLH